MPVILKAVMAPIGGILKGMLISYLKTFATKEFVEWGLDKLIRWWVESTETKADDEFYRKFCELKEASESAEK